MASSSEARPEDVAEVAPVAEKVEAVKSAAEEPTEKKPTSDEPTVRPQDEPPQESDSKGGDEKTEKNEKNDTEKAKDEPSIPSDAAAAATDGDAPTSPPPLPDEPLPDEEQGPTENDDGWDPMWSDEHQAWYFVNRFTQQTQWENPRVPSASASGAAAASGAVTGYNPAIHGDYDPNAWYARGEANPDEVVAATAGAGEDGIAAAAAAAAAIIQEGAGTRYSNDAKASRQLNSFFDVAAANSAHDGRSLKAERSGIKPSKSELKAFKEKRRARKEEKRRAWLRD